MTQTVRLLEIIGSPFNDPGKKALPKDAAEARELYCCSVKNKIGLMFLSSLEERGKITEYGLSTELSEERRRYAEQSGTCLRVSGLFNSEGVDYALFKSIMPFAATPNDVDIIHFGSDAEFRRAAEVLLRNNYFEVKGPVDARQRMFHDGRCGPHPDPHKKDVYDTDVYQRISASHILYLDKKKLKKHAIDSSFMGQKVRALDPETELMTIIIHAVIPEMLFTLFIYYATLYYMKSIDTGKLLCICRENNVSYALKAHMSIVAELHKAAHGSVPEEIEALLKKTGYVKSEVSGLQDNGYRVPHRYSLRTVALILLEKSREGSFLASAVRQAIAMLNPRMFKWVVNNIVWRRTRDTY